MTRNQDEKRSVSYSVLLFTEESQMLDNWLELRMAKKRDAISRLVRWFCCQSPEVQDVVMGIVPRGYEGRVAELIDADRNVDHEADQIIRDAESDREGDAPKPRSGRRRG